MKPLGDPGALISTDDLAARLGQPGLRVYDCTTYCGGGTSATIDLFLLQQLGFDDLTLCDGSMGEWAKDPSLPIETD